MPLDYSVDYFQSPDQPGFFRFEFVLPPDYDSSRQQAPPIRDWFQSIRDFQWDGLVLETFPMRTYFDVPTTELHQVLDILRQQIPDFARQHPTTVDRRADGYFTVNSSDSGTSDGYTQITVYSMDQTPIDFPELDGIDMHCDPFYSKSLPPQISLYVRNEQQQLPNGGNAVDRVREILMTHGFAEEDYYQQ